MKKICIFVMIALILAGVTACKKTSSKNAVVIKAGEEKSAQKLLPSQKKERLLKL